MKKTIKINKCNGYAIFGKERFSKSFVHEKDIRKEVEKMEKQIDSEKWSGWKKMQFNKLVFLPPTLSRRIWAVDKWDDEIYIAKLDIDFERAQRELIGKTILLDELDKKFPADTGTGSWGRIAYKNYIAVSNAWEGDKNATLTVRDDFFNEIKVKVLVVEKNEVGFEDLDEYDVQILQKWDEYYIKPISLAYGKKNVDIVGF